MPSDLRPIIVVRGTDDYREALETLQTKAGVPSVADLAVLGIEMLAKAHGVELPKRLGQRGGTRPKAGRPKNEK